VLARKVRERSVGNRPGRYTLELACCRCGDVGSSTGLASAPSFAFGFVQVVLSFKAKFGMVTPSRG